MSNDQNHESRHSSTVQLAYHLWEQAGRPDGRDLEFWTRAEEKMAASGWHAPHTPAEPADPHPSDEDRSNVHNPSPGGDTHSEAKDRSIDRLRKDDPGSPA